MKFFHFCLFVAVVFFAVSCGSRKTDEQTYTGDASDSITENDAVPQDDDTVSGETIPDDSDETNDEETGHDPDPADTEDQVIPDETPDEKPDEGNPECDIENGVTFVRQPQKMNIAPNGRSVYLTYKIEAKDCGITYQWYESPDGKASSGKALSGATNQTFETPVFTEKGIRYYFCNATASTPSGESRILRSDIVSVAYTALPTLYINTPGGVEIASKEEWVKNASLFIAGAEDESWNSGEIVTSIRGRGNSTWSLPKKPYALKLKTARGIMGMPEHKRWVLLANYWDGSFMRNVVAFYFSRLFEFDWTPHGQFVDLVLNGKYNGLYWLGEAIKVDKNRVDINDGNQDMTDGEDKDYLIEIDIFFDEILKFRSGIRDLPYMIRNEDWMVDKNDAITTGGAARLERLQTKINDLEKQLYPDFTVVSDTNDCSAPDESYADTIDIDSWIKFWFVNEITDNWDSGNPRSCFFTFDSTNNIFKAGPVWDFDTASSNRAPTCRLTEATYYNALFKSPAFTARTKELWNEYSGRIDFEPEIETVRSRIGVAAQYDTMLWTWYHDYINIFLENNSVRVFDEYADFLKESINKKIPVVNDFIENL